MFIRSTLSSSSAVIVNTLSSFVLLIPYILVTHKVGFVHLGFQSLVCLILDLWGIVQDIAPYLMKGGRCLWRLHVQLIYTVVHLYKKYKKTFTTYLRGLLSFTKWLLISWRIRKGERHPSITLTMSLCIFQSASRGVASWQVYRLLLLYEHCWAFLRSQLG